jgi:class 3 adenylate cyclase
MLRAFLIADIRGYTAFTREHGDQAAAQLARAFADLARDAVEARSGTVIELRGDEALAVFPSSSQAIRAALELQAVCHEETAADPTLPLPVGIGIDAGDAVPVEGGFRGVALNMAARLCSKAAAGEVLVTRTAADLAIDVSGVRFEERGRAELKGFEQPVELLQAVWLDLPALRVPMTLWGSYVTPPLAAGYDEASFPSGCASSSRGTDHVGWEAGTGEQPRDHRVRVPHVADPDLISAPDQSRHRTNQVEETTRQLRVVTQALGTRHRLIRVRNDPVPPPAHLVSKHAVASHPAATDRAFHHHAARSTVAIGDGP